MQVSTDAVVKKWSKHPVPHPAMSMLAASLVPGICMRMHSDSSKVRELTPSRCMPSGSVKQMTRFQGIGQDGSRVLTIEISATRPRGTGRGPSTQQRQRSCRWGSLCLLGNGTAGDTGWASGCPFCRSGPWDRSSAMNRQPLPLLQPLTWVCVCRWAKLINLCFLITCMTLQRREGK